MSESVEPYDLMIDQQLQDLSTRVHNKIKEHGSKAVFHFDEEEYRYYKEALEPWLLKQKRRKDAR